MEIHEARSGVKALFLQAASLAGVEVHPNAPEELAHLVDDGLERVKRSRQPEAVANLLQVIAATLWLTQENRDETIKPDTIKHAKSKICPVFPFD